MNGTANMAIPNEWDCKYTKYVHKVVRVPVLVIGAQPMTREYQVPVILNDSVPGVPNAEITEYSQVAGAPSNDSVPGVPNAEIT